MSKAPPIPYPTLMNCLELGINPVAASRISRGGRQSHAIDNGLEAGRGEARRIAKRLRAWKRMNSAALKIARCARATITVIVLCLLPDG